MKAYIQEHFAISAHALIIVVVLLFATWYVDSTHARIESLILNKIERQHASLVEIAEITDRNGVDPVAEKIIADCPRRVEFEEMLARLGSLEKRDLVLVQQLFESCGAFYSERKALMVSRLEQAYTVLEDNLLLLATLRDLSPKESMYAGWENLLTLEIARSNYLADQTRIQEQIISALIAGDTGINVTERIREAQEINESLVVVDRQIDVARDTLLID